MRLKFKILNIFLCIAFFVLFIIALLMTIMLFYKLGTNNFGIENYKFILGPVLLVTIIIKGKKIFFDKDKNESD